MSDPSNAREGTSEALGRDWHNIVGHNTAEWSRPVAIVDGRIIVETEQGKSFGAHDMRRALDSLGREDVDRVAIRVVDRNAPRIESATPDELAARLWGPPVTGEKQAIGLKMQRGIGR